MIGETAPIPLAGEIDVATAKDVAATLAPAIASGAEVVVVDLSEVTFMDSSGLSVLVHVYRTLDRDGRRLALVGAPDRLRRLFTVSGLERLLDPR